MDYKRNALFFHHKRNTVWTWVTYLSFALFAVTFVMLLSFHWYVPIALPPAIVGVTLLLLALSMTTSEKQLRQQITQMTDAAKEEAMAHFDYPDINPDFFFVFEGYDFAPEDLLFRKNRNGRAFSSVYTVTYLLFDKECLRLFQKSASLVEEKGSLVTKDLPIASLKGAEALTETVSRHCIDGNTREFERHFLRLTDAAGETVCTVPCKARDYDMDRFCETLSHHEDRLHKKSEP